MPESADLIDDQDKTGAFREENVIAEKLNEFFALIHAHCESNWGVLNAIAFSGEDPSEDLSKTEVTANNFKELKKQTVKNHQDWIITQQF